MKKINFQKLPDVELYKYLKHYCLLVPQDENGKLIRGEAVQQLIQYQLQLEAEEDRRMKYVVIGLNGRGYQIPFDKEVVLPESVVRVCDDAVVTSFKQSDKSSLGKIVHDSFEHKTYPYTILEYMDAEGMMLPEEN